MLTILFTICMFWIFGKILVFGIKATWGLSKLLFTVVLLPFVLVGMVLGGLLFLVLYVSVIYRVHGSIPYCFLSIFYKKKTVSPFIHFGFTVCS